MGAPGCDDAPVVLVERDVLPLRRITMIYPYYENPEFLKVQMAKWMLLPWQGLSEYMSVIVVDDGSPNSPAEAVMRTMPYRPFRLFRIGVDVRWNWLAARNIGAHHAPDGWILLTDMDHVVPEDTLRAVIYGRLRADTIYRFSRVGSKTHPHPNSWLMTKRMFWQVGGYDETLSGHYGTDGEYRRRCAATAPINILREPLELHEYEGDSSTTHYLRKQPVDAAAKRMIRARQKDWRPKTLSFPYQEVNL